MYIIEKMLNMNFSFFDFEKLWILTLISKFYIKPKTLVYHQCDQFSITFIFLYVKSYCKVNK
jgi:hypothetical protein